MSNNIEFSIGEFGLNATIKSEWQDTYVDLLKSKGIKSLELNDGKGWKGKNLDFLVSLSDLESLTLIDFSIKKIEEIHTLSKLQHLEISTYSNDSVDFSCFPNLRQCSFEWISGSDSLFEVYHLENLFINNYNGRDSKVFSGFQNLRSLGILNSKIEDIKGLSALYDLMSLRIGNLRNISKLSGLEKLHNLKELEIQKCKGISEISEVFHLVHLKRLLLLDLGEIASLRGIENLNELMEFYFYESTNIMDGDLSQLEKLVNLKSISFQNRRHYTHKREDFDNIFS